MAGYHHYKERKYEVGQRLLTLRRKANLTQIELADLVAISRRSIQNWEAGTAYPKEDGLQRLIHVFLDQQVFTPGQEREEAEALWELVSLDAPNSLALFDAAWFDKIRGQGLEAGDRAEIDSSRPPMPDSQPLLDWGEAIDVPVLYGREAELATLQQWVVRDRCRVVALLGLGGIGKTSLAITFAQQVSSHFEAVFFRSLRNAPPLSPVLDDLIRAISAQQATPPDSISDKISLLVQLLRERRCLLVLDNLEAIIQAGAPVGYYRAGYADYGRLIQGLGEAAHQGCLLLTSREKPNELGPLEGRTAPVRTFLLTGLADYACQTILGEKDLVGATTEYAALARLYGGNPLALKLVSEPIREVFGGNVGAFLASGDAFFNGVGQLLEQQFSRLTPLEQTILYWLAIEREITSLETLLVDLTGVAVQREVLQALESLRRRLLIERSTGQSGFTLQPVIMEYMTDQLVEAVYQEIVRGQPALLRSHSLVQATAPDYVRQTQERLIATPLLDRLVAAGEGTDAAEERLLDLLEAWRGQPVAAQGYGPGNVVNLLRVRRGDLRGIDLSHLVIRQAYLQEIEAQEASLVGAHLAETVLAGAFDYSVCVAFSADGAYLVAGTASGEMWLWEVTNRTPIMSVQAHEGGVYGVALSADGQLVVSGSVDGTVKLWRAQSSACLAILHGHTRGIHGVALSADGQIIASVSFDGTIRLWEVDSGQHLTTLQGHIGAVHCVALSADGRLVISSGMDGTIRLWEVSSGICLLILQGHTGGVWSVALSANGRLAASGGLDGTVRLWDTSALRQSSGQTTLTAGTSSGVCLAVLQGHTGMIWGVALSADGRLAASGGLDGTVRLWDTSALRQNTGQAALSADTKGGACLAILQGHTDGVRGLALSADGRLVASGSFDGTIQLWEVDGGRHLATLQGHTNLVYGVAFSANGQLMASGGIVGMVELWEVDTGRLLATLQGHRGSVHGVALSADGGMVASGGLDGTIWLWDTSTLRLGSGQALRQISAQVAHSTNAASGQRSVTLQGHTDMVWSVAISADGRLVASGSYDKTVRLWDTRTAFDGGAANSTYLTTLRGHTDGVRSVAISADGRLVASGGLDGTIRLWEVDSGQHLTTLQGHVGLIWSVAISADGRLIASGGEDETVRLWATDTGRLLTTLQGHRGSVIRVALSGDGRLVASSGMDGTVRLWQVADRMPLLSLQAHTGAIWGMALSEDGRLVASGGRDGMVTLWETSSGIALRTLRPDRPYERMDITGLTGVTEAQRGALKALGALERDGHAPSGGSE